MAFCGLPPGLVESQFLAELQMQRIAAGDGAEAGHARRRLLAHRAEAKRPSRMIFNRKSVLRCPTPWMVSYLKNLAVPTGLENLARVIVRAVDQPAGAMSWNSARSTTNLSKTRLVVSQVCDGACDPLDGDVKIDGALVSQSIRCFLHGVQHHYGPQLLAAVMDR